MAQSRLQSLMAFFLLMISYAITSPLSSAEINLFDEPFSDSLKPAKLSQRSYPFPKERCDSYFGVPDTLDCIGAVKTMYDPIPAIARDSYETFTNDNHLAGLQSLNKQSLPQAFYGPRARCAMRISINDELNLPPEEQWDMSTWDTLRLEATSILIACTDRAAGKTGGTQIIGHRNKLNITIYEPFFSDYEIEVAKETWQPRQSLRDRPGISSLPQASTLGSAVSGGSGQSWTIPTAQQANYCTSTITCQIEYQIETTCKALDIGRQFIDILFGAVEKVVRWGVCEGGTDISVKRNKPHSQPRDLIKSNTQSPNKPTSPLPSLASNIDQTLLSSPASKIRRTPLTTLTPSNPNNHPIPLELYCLQNPLTPGCRFHTYIKTLLENSICNHDPICLRAAPYVGKCILITISISALFLLYGLRAAAEAEAEADRIVAQGWVEDRLLDRAFEEMTRGMQQLDCLEGNQLTNRGLGRGGGCVGVCQWRVDEG
ncbi:MAG: hypothetical protein M1812_002943 [Candelaria pacifica]|nr:MAG: hypothetical protein M1812_002943 [Candelaria pacifica]